MLGPGGTPAKCILTAAPFSTKCSSSRVPSVCWARRVAISILNSFTLYVGASSVPIAQSALVTPLQASRPAADHPSTLLTRLIRAN